MPTYSPGDVVIVAFPFTNAMGTKRRPALVLLDHGDADIVVARITSETARNNFDVELKDWRKAGLLLPFVVRANKLATLEKSLVERKSGTLTTKDWAQVCSTVRMTWSSF